MHRLRQMLLVAGATVAVVVVSATSALAQVEVDPNFVPERNDGGWIWWLAWLCAIMGVVLAGFLTVVYMRYAPSFKREDEVSKVVFADRILPGADAPRREVDLSQAVPIVVQPPALPSAVAAVSSQAAAPAPAATATATDAPAAAAPSPAAAPAPAAAAPAPAPAAPAERVEVSMDQEAYDAKLAELLAAGTDRRVAEGQARRAGMIAAKKKAAGEG